MDTKLIDKLTDKEINVLDKAADELFDIGCTRLTCPRCGNGFDIIKNGSSYQVKCMTEGCIKLTSRGI